MKRVVKVKEGKVVEVKHVKDDYVLEKNERVDEKAEIEILAPENQENQLDRIEGKIDSLINDGK
jgi:hypothetical protein